MAVSKPKAIKNYLAAAFAAINGTGGYENTVCSVNEKAGNRVAEVSKGAAEVWVEISKITNNLTGTRGLRSRRATYKITGQVINPRDATDSDGLMLSLYADLVRAIELDATCGGVAFGLKWADMTPVIGDPSVECVFTVEADFVEART